ncbi:LPP20 family lipoprotein [bacterium]|nr:LPP20 family lipoprotein [bacterium]
MKKLSFLLSLLVLAIALVGCGGGKKTVKQQVKISDIPEWFLETPKDPNYIISAASGFSRDLQMALNTATEEARVNIARELETKVSGLFKRFREEVGTGDDSEFLSQTTDVSKSVVSTTLNGTKVRKKEVKNEGGGYRVYVLMEMALGATNEALLNKIKEQKNMYTRFRASQGFQELEKDVKEYEEFKAKGGY